MFWLSPRTRESPQPLFQKQYERSTVNLVSAPVHAGPGARPASFTVSTRSFPRVKRPGSGADYPRPPSAEVKESAKLHFYSPSRSSRQVTRWNLPFTFTLVMSFLTVCLPAIDSFATGLCAARSAAVSLTCTPMQALRSRLAPFLGL